MSAAPSTIAAEFAQRAELMAALSLADPSAPEAGQPSLEATERALTLARALADPRSEALAAAWRCVHLFRRGRHGEVVRRQDDEQQAHLLVRLDVADAARFARRN